MSIGAILNQVFPKPMLPQILVTPIVSFSSVTASNGLITYNGVYNGSVWVIDVDDFGDYDITAVKSDGSGTSEDTVSVTVNRQYEVMLGVSNVLDENSWAVISSISANNLGASLWSVGDAKQITINGMIGSSVSYNNLSVWVYILGFNHNAELEGNNKIHFGCFRSGQDYTTTNNIALDDSVYANGNPGGILCFNIRYPYNLSGGWASSRMRTTLIDADADSPTSVYPNSFLAVLPSDLKAVLKQCTKYTDNTGGKNNVISNVTATEDWAFLLSEFEVFGTRTYANSYEQNYQKQYQYYINGNSKIKYRQSNNESASWWLRSPSIVNKFNFCIVEVSGFSENKNSEIPYGFAPAFCV